MRNEYERLMSCLECVREKVDFQPKIAIVLGSGLGNYGENIDVRYTVNYSDIAGFPVSTVAGHQGRYLFGYLEGVPVVVMQGRVHYYEGYTMQEVVLPIRLMRLMGAEILFLTNASGGVNPEFLAGDMMLITDQISQFVPSPLIGQNLDILGTRFPDMSQIYDAELQKILRETAGQLGIPLKEGVYIQFTGPNYETPADIRMSRILGADAVGMSTACEAIAANHMGMRVCGVSLISNMAAGITKQPLTHTEVQQAADAATPRFKALVRESVKRMGIEEY